jgi:hypothetical protein
MASHVAPLLSMTGAHKSARPSKRMRTTGGDSDSEDEAGRAPRGAEEEDLEAPRGEVEEGVERFQIHAGGTVFCVAGTVTKHVCVLPRALQGGHVSRCCVSSVTGKLPVLQRRWWTQSASWR